MSFLEELLEVADEIKRLRAMEKRYENSLGSAQEKIAELESRIKLERELERLLVPVLEPEMFDEYSEKAQRLRKRKEGGEHLNYFDEKELEALEKILSQPKAIGSTVLCTYDDLGADSGSNNSSYTLFLLVSDGRVLPIENLGLYGGAFSSPTQPSLKRVIVRKLPHVETKEISQKAPQCFDAAKALSDRKEEVK